jgi:hypothetical protein
LKCLNAGPGARVSRSNRVVASDWLLMQYRPCGPIRQIADGPG